MFQATVTLNLILSLPLEYIFVWSIGLHLSDVIAGKPGNHLGLVQEKAV